MSVPYALLGLLEQEPRHGYDLKRLVDRYMNDPVSHETGEDEPTVDEMDHVFLAVHQMDKVKVAAAIANANNRTMMFMRTKRGADRLVEQLGREGVRALAIHGDLRQGAREKALADFMSGMVHVLVATDVAARGIHVDGVDVVIHYDPPEDEKAYLHRSGRTARAGATGTVVTLATPEQVGDVRSLTRQAGITPTTTALEPGHHLLRKIAPGPRTYRAPDRLADHATASNGASDPAKPRRRGHAPRSVTSTRRGGGAAAFSASTRVGRRGR